MPFCGLLSKRKHRDEPYQKSTRPMDGVISGQQAVPKRNARSKAEQFTPKSRGEYKSPARHGHTSRSASTSSAYTSQAQVRSSSMGGDAVNYRKPPTGRSPQSTHIRVSVPPGPEEGKKVTQFHSLPDVRVSKTSPVTETQPSRDFRESYNQKAADPRDITNTSKLPALGINDRPFKGHGKEHLCTEMKQTGKHSVSLQEQTADFKQHISQSLRSTDGEKEVQNFSLRSENTNLKKEVEGLLDIESKGYELVEQLQREIKRLNEENTMAVEDLTNTVSDLDSQNKKYIFDLECLQVENDRLKGECHKLKGTVRKLGLENNNLRKELGKSRGSSPAESPKIRRSSVSQSDLLDQIHECEMQLNAKKTEIKQLEKELEEASSKDRHLIHDIQRLTVELEDQRCNLRAANDKNSKLQLCLDSLQLLLKDSGILEAGRDLNECVGNLLVRYQTCIRTVEKLQTENERLTQQIKQQGDQGREISLSLMSDTRDLRQQVQEAERRLNEYRTDFSKLQKNYEDEIRKVQTGMSDIRSLSRELESAKREVSCVTHDKNELQQIVESKSVVQNQLARENAELKRNVSELEMRHEKLAQSLSVVLKQNERDKKSMAVFHSKQAKIRMELEDENNRLRQDLSGLMGQYQSLKQEYSDFRQESSLQIQERDDKLKQSSVRISKLVAENVGRSNPCLEDLSSQNRSMKIAERFRGDLYGDTWCDALDLLMVNDVPEEDALKTICDTLVAVYEFCRDHCARVVQYASSTLVNLSDAGLDSSLMATQETGSSLEHLHSAMKDYLRASAMSVTPDKLLQLYTNTGGADTSPHSVALVEFTRQALAICWCMVTQDPPMSLAYKLAPGDAFDPRSFQTYRSSGNRAKFLVWPALLLTDSGPLMEKGVVYT